MTKEEKIKEAYGRHWESVKEFVDEDGYLKITDVGLERFNDIYLDHPHWNIYRPQILRNLENNNGWITIESENDLPPDGHYWTINKKGEINASPKLVDETCNDNQYWLSTFTHYQPILKPKPPLY